MVKIVDDTNGIIGKQINEQEAVTSFHGRNENTSSLHYHQMKFKNFNFKHRVEIETSNVLVRKEHVHHNVKAFARRYDFVVVCRRSTNLFRDEIIHILHSRDITKFYAECIDYNDLAVNNHLETISTIPVSKSKFAELITDKMIQNYNYSKDNLSYRAKSIKKIKGLLSKRQ